MGRQIDTRIPKWDYACGHPSKASRPILRRLSKCHEIGRMRGNEDPHQGSGVNRIQIAPPQEPRTSIHVKVCCGTLQHIHLQPATGFELDDVERAVITILRQQQDIPFEQRKTERQAEPDQGIAASANWLDPLVDQIPIQEGTPTLTKFRAVLAAIRDGEATRAFTTVRELLADFDQPETDEAILAGSLRLAEENEALKKRILELEAEQTTNNYTTEKPVGVQLAAVA